MVLVVIGVFVVLANQGSARDSAPIGQPAPASTVQQVVAIGPSVLSTVGTGRLDNPLRAISGPALTSDGKPQVLYIGGDFCPVCAADRWSLVNALSRFGTFSNLHYSRSAVDDGDLATFTFHDSSYASAYISFVSVEHEDRDRNLLEPLTSEQAQLLSTLGDNAYPFVDIAGQYINRAPNAYVGGYDQTVLSGKDWAQIAGALHNPNDPITQGVVGSANYLTAAICTVTHNQPSSACGTSTIRQIQQQLLQQR
jgi:uncharacterized protein DUF929